MMATDTFIRGERRDVDETSHLRSFPASVITAPPVGVPTESQGRPLLPELAWCAPRRLPATS